MPFEQQTFHRSFATFARVLFFLGLVGGSYASIPANLRAADWPTHRGNNQRTGCIDGKPGPQTAKVLWVHASQEHYLAAPVIGGESLIVSGIAGFGNYSISALALDPAAAKRIVWTKTPPYLKLAVFSSPACVDKTLVFGDGMHVDGGATLHAVNVETGEPRWQFPLAGTLIHMENGPSVQDGKVFLGAGNGGVLCLDPTHLTLAGKEVSSSEVASELAVLWKAALAKYEEEKKKDPDFAVPPTKDGLPKPKPKLVWQQGQERWHVDAVTAVAGDKVIAASAFLDNEKIGERVLAALKTSDGSIVWKTPLAFNPWDGPTIAGDLVLVGGSNIRLEPKTIPEGKGQVVALSLADGKEKWKTDLAGGVLGPVAVQGDLAVCTSTDGKIRGLDLATGAVRWTYNARAPFFAGVAIAGETVYAGDLKGVVHAISLSLGKKVWTLDLAADPTVKAAGMIYGSPVVQGGRVYVATSNLDEGSPGKTTAVVCIGEK